MDYQLYDFIPLYNPIQTSAFDRDISNLKEFTENKLGEEEDFPQHPGDLMLHQKLISKFINPQTPYDGLLLVHEMGTGKTCTAVGVVEEFIKSRQDGSKFPSTTIKNVVVLTKGKGLQNNFINEVANVCTKGQYLQGLEKYVRNRERRIKRNVKVNYTFDTFEIFAKKLSQMSDREKNIVYENSLFIVDEAHNLRVSSVVEESRIYSQISGLFDLLQTKKILLLTGTPMKDKPEEIVDLLNLILKEKLTLEDLENDTLFKQKIGGYISYLRAMMSDVNRGEVGELMGTLSHFKVYPVAMDNFQAKVYLEAKRKDDEERSIFNHSRQSSLLVFPDGSYGKSGFEKNILQTVNNYKLKSPQVALELQRNPSKYSAKYADLLDKLQKDYKRGRLAFVFSEFVKGSGLMVLSLLLELNGYSRATLSSNLNKPQKRYVIFTNETSTDSQTRQLISSFNNAKNIHGEYISVILGSRVVMEGFSFKNIQSEYILTPHWNYSETSQIIARGLRLGSHNNLIKQGIIPEVKIYHYVAMPDNGDSIDLKMYQISEEKDFRIQKVIRLLKEVAFDCRINKVRNTITNPTLNDRRECEYTSCEYTCDNPIEIKDGDDLRNYNLLYFENSKNYTLLEKFILEKVIQQPITLEEIIQETNHSYFEVLLVVQNIIGSRKSLFNRPEGSYYLQSVNNLFFISTNITGSKEDPSLLDFYNKYSTIYRGKSIDEMIFNNQQGFMVDSIDKIFKSKNLVELQKVMVQLPIYLQEKLLSLCISTSFKDTPNNFVRDMVLNNFKLYYNLDGQKGFIWLHPEKYKCTNNFENINGWRECTFEEAKQIEDMKKKGKSKIKVVNNKIGYVGLLNRSTNDFCLRKVEDDQDENVDKRKRNVGKRCQNWKKQDLVDLVSNRLKIKPDEDFDFDQSDVEKMRNNPKLKNILNIDNGTLKDYKRVAFWNAQDINYLCTKIMQNLMDSKLVMDDPNCGTSKKVR